MPRSREAGAPARSRVVPPYAPLLCLSPGLRPGSTPGCTTPCGSPRCSGELYFFLEYRDLHPDDAHLRTGLREWLQRHDLPPLAPDQLDELNRRIPDKDVRVSRPTCVVDAKYKAEKPGGFPHADLYQLLAYCTALRLPVGHLVYAKGNEQGRTHDVAGTHVTIRAHTLDLAAPPSDLLAEVDSLATRIAEDRLR